MNMMIIVVRIIMVMCLMVVTVMAMVVVLVIITQNPSTGNVDQKSKRRDSDGLFIGYGHRMDQMLHALIANRQGDHGQNNGAHEAAQIAQFAGPKGKALIMYMFGGVNIGQRRNGKG